MSAPEDPIIPPDNQDAQSILENETLTSDEYYSNPLVSDVSALSGGTELTQMIKALDTVNPTTASIIGTKSAETKTSYISDPFYFEGKLVKFGRFYITNVEIPQNSSWSGYQDYYEDGRLMGFSVTCNDSDMIPVCFVENAVGSRDVMNDLSFKEAVWHGRGMTYGEAASTVRTSEGLTSRDVSGTPLTIFPYISRYKDQFTGTAVYDDIKNTIDDKTYVMNFEPNVFVPYQRLYFDVYNGSSVGTKIIIRLEIKRIIYVDPDQDAGNLDKTSELSQFNKDIQSLYDKINAAKPALNPPVLPTAAVVDPTATVTAPTIASFATEVPNLYEDFIKYSYDKLNQKNVTKADLSGKKVRIADLHQQETMQDLLRQVNGEKPVKRKREKPKDDTMIVKWS